MNPTREGLARPDVLVLSVLVVLTLGLVLPAAQEVKEAEKRKRCVDNLKQIGLAAHNYQSVYNKLPPGWLGSLQNEAAPKFEQAQNLSVLAFLLPYLEQDNVYRELQRQSPGGDYLNLNVARPAWFTVEGLRTVGSTRIVRFLCPSAPDAAKAADGILAAVHFAHNEKGPVTPALHTLPPKDAAFDRLGRTNYFGVAGMWGRGTNAKFANTRIGGLNRFEGIFTNRSLNSIDQLTSADGTSNTLMFGEGTGGSHDWEADKPAAKAPVQYAASWIGGGVLPTGGGLARHGEPSFWYQFSSTHDDVVHFCFGDGAVRALRTAKTGTRFLPTPKVPDEPAALDAPAAYWIVQELAGMRDGGLRPVASIVVKDEP